MKYGRLEFPPTRCNVLSLTQTCSVWQSARLIISHHNNPYKFTGKILNIGTCMSEQTVKILIRLLLRSSLIRIYTVCHSFYIFWRHYFIVKLNCFIFRTTTVAGLGVPIFRVFMVVLICLLKIISFSNLTFLSYQEACTPTFHSC